MWISRSKNDPNGDRGGLQFLFKEKAEKHAKLMNFLREGYETDGTWNKDFWKEQPMDWIVYETKI